MELPQLEGTRTNAGLDRLRMIEGSSARAVVLVEGISDQRALEALAERRGRALDAEGVRIIPIGGSRSIGAFLERFGPQGLEVRLAGLCDAAEEGDFRHGLERSGFGSNLTRADMERLGFFVCVADLEDELIRSLGAAAVEEVIAGQGELASFRTFQKQPAWQGAAPAILRHPQGPEDQVSAPARRGPRSQSRASAAGRRARSYLTRPRKSAHPCPSLQMPRASVDIPKRTKSRGRQSKRCRSSRRTHTPTHLASARSSG